jgi:hypothetical protein
MRSISAHWPNRWTGMMALVLGDITASSLSTSMLNVSRRMSTKTGVAPNRVMQLTEAKKVKLGTITSSPGPTDKAIKARSSASLPDAHPIACATWLCAAISFSNSSTSGPKKNFPLSITRPRASKNSCRRGWFPRPTSNRGTELTGTDMSGLPWLGGRN